MPLSESTTTDPPADIVSTQNHLPTRQEVEEDSSLMFSAALLMTGLPDASLRCTRASFAQVARSKDVQAESNPFKIRLLKSLFETLKRPEVVSLRPSDRGESIQSLLLTVDPVYREVIVLRHCLGLTLHEIGEILSLPSRKITSRLSIGRHMLHDHLTMRKGT